MRSALGIVIVYTAFLSGIKCYKILGAFQLNGKSHFIVFEALMKGLAARGHQVVVISHFPQKNPVPNYTDIDVSESSYTVQDNVTIDTALSWDTAKLSDFIWSGTREMCRDTMNHPNVQTLLKSTDSFDLVITEICGSECTIGFAHKFKTPLVHIVTSIAFPWTHARIGNPDHPAYVPSYFLPYSDKMNFWQRLTNTVYNVVLNIGNDIYNNKPTYVLMREYFGEGVPSVEQLVNNASLVLVNSHFSINWPRPAVPAFVEVGGLHIQKPGKLPQDLQKFVDESVHGVIYFNMGSLVRVQSFPQEKIKALLDAFGALPERVLMKYTEDSLPGKPENVKISKWVPQLDVLCHPKTKLFISHGGLGGTQETVYAGVPVVGIPFFGDQRANINNLQSLGMAIKFSYEDITSDNLLKAIRTVIDDSSYSESAKRVSAVFRDRPMTALETAVYWVEYVIRHRGAPHLRSAAADMNLYQYLLLDVIGVLLLVAATSVCVVYCAVKTVLRALTGGRPAAQHGKHKQQ